MASHSPSWTMRIWRGWNCSGVGIDGSSHELILVTQPAPLAAEVSLTDLHLELVTADLCDDDVTVGWRVSGHDQRVSAFTGGGQQSFAGVAVDDRQGGLRGVQILNAGEHQPLITDRLPDV